MQAIGYCANSVSPVSRGRAAAAFDHEAVVAPLAAERGEIVSIRSRGLGVAYDSRPEATRAADDPAESIREARFHRAQTAGTTAAASAVAIAS